MCKIVKQMFVNIRGYMRLHWHILLVPTYEKVFASTYRYTDSRSPKYTYVPPECFYQVIGLENL